MADYMPDTLGADERIPLSKIVILTATNGDGIMDERKVFLDSPGITSHYLFDWKWNSRC